MQKVVKMLFYHGNHNMNIDVLIVMHESASETNHGLKPSRKLRADCTISVLRDVVY